MIVTVITNEKGATGQGATRSHRPDRERPEAVHEYLLQHPPLGLAIQRHRDEFFLVTAPELGAAIERHLGNARPVPLSRTVTGVLAIVAYKQAIRRAGIELIRGANSETRWQPWACANSSPSTRPVCS